MTVIKAFERKFAIMTDSIRVFSRGQWSRIVLFAEDANPISGCKLGEVR
ncbi:hypothetical protein [Sinorhizobium sp. GL28]|nr:hypothetical protein [Sinorhizobium sp. GL28]KSV88554.1 hypothetical protein N184_28800 [Sinorhizobium sp. GL28]